MKKKRPLTKAQKARQAVMAWRAAHPEEYKAYQLKYQKRWRKNNPDYFKTWQVDNRDYVAEMKRRYRARKRKSAVRDCAMTSTRAAIVAVVLAFSAFPYAGATKAADKCLSRSEARAVWPRAYLYWRNEGGKRCWSSRRGRSVASRPPRQAVPEFRDAPAPPPPSVDMPAGLMPPQHAIVAPPSILDSPRWQWVAEARAAAHEDDYPIFSTFAPGAEPDIWPRLPEPTNAGGIVVVVMSGFLAMALGLALWRRQIGRVRITP